MNSQYPPFYVGQKVKCINASFPDNSPKETEPKQGVEYVITEVKFECCQWTVGIGIQSTVGMAACATCRRRWRETSAERPFAASRFRAITEDFQAITFEKVVEEELVSMN